MRLNIDYLHLHRKPSKIWRKKHPWTIFENIFEIKNQPPLLLAQKTSKNYEPSLKKQNLNHVTELIDTFQHSAKCFRIQSPLSIYTIQISESQRWQFFVMPLSRILNHKPTFWNECWTKFHTQGYCCWIEFAQFRIFETSKIIWDSSITIKWNG